MKQEMWLMVAREMEIPWRSAEAMHWKLGEQEMARRAGVTPFSLSAVALDAPPRRRGSASGVPSGLRQSQSPSGSGPEDGSASQMPERY